MTPAIAQKTAVEAKWSIEKRQEETANAFARQFLTTMATLGKLGPEIHEEFSKNLINSKVEYYKQLGVKTPIDLVNAMAEFESNIFGSKIEIVGDEKKAELIYNQCACWNAMQKVGNLNPQQQERMGKQHEQSIQKIAEAFGFKGELKIEEPRAIITFSK
jgi:hypothetical protein